MNLEKLKILENRFLDRYPLGFNDPELMEIAKKHKVDAMKAFVEEQFKKENFDDPKRILDAFSKLIGKSSLVSVFEKVKFKDVYKLFTSEETEILSQAIYDFLYGDQRLGFNQLVLLFANYDLAKWPILTVLGLYNNGDYEVLVKPTTAKGVLSYLEVTDIQYTSKPNYDFYEKYRTFINDLKAQTGNSLATDNGAYCGFLMLTIE